MIDVNKKNELFSPPYGDGTAYHKRVEQVCTFSPPYGDGTLNISQKIVK